MLLQVRGSSSCKHLNFRQASKTIFRDQIIKVFLVVFSQLVIIGVLSVPVVYYADVMEIEILSESGQNLTHLETIRMCRSDMPDEILPSFVFMMVLLGCIVPTTITWCSYVCLVICLGKKSGMYLKKCHTKKIVFL